MEPTVTKNNGRVATFSDGSTNLCDRLSEYGYSRALQKSQFENIFIVGRTKAEITAILKDPGKVAEAADEDGKATGTIIPQSRINVGDKGFHTAVARFAEREAQAPKDKK